MSRARRRDRAEKALVDALAAIEPEVADARARLAELEAEEASLRAALSALGAPPDAPAPREPKTEGLTPAAAAVLASLAMGPATAPQLTAAVPWLTRQQATNMLSRLAGRGLVREAGLERRKGAGRPGMAWELTPAGERAANAGERATDAAAPA